MTTQPQQISFIPPPVPRVVYEYRRPRVYATLTLPAFESNLELYCVGYIVTQIATQRHPCEDYCFCDRYPSNCQTYNGPPYHTTPCRETNWAKLAEAEHLIKNIYDDIQIGRYKLVDREHHEIMVSPPVYSIDGPSHTSWFSCLLCPWLRNGYFSMGTLTAFCEHNGIKLSFKPDTMEESRENTDCSSGDLFYSTPTTNKILNSNKKPERKPKRYIAEVHEFLHKNPLLTSKAVMDELIKKIGSPGTCIIGNIGYGLKWEDEQGEFQELTREMLDSCLYRWRQKHRDQYLAAQSTLAKKS